MIDFTALNRRRFLAAGAATAATAAGIGRAAAAKPFTVGFIYVGSETDYGYNQAHAEAEARHYQQLNKLAMVA